MEKVRTRNFVSALVITVMVASIFVLPVVDDDYAVQAATKKAKVTYRANKGKFTARKYAKKKSYSKNITKGKKIGKLPKIKRSGYKLKGWYTKKSGGKKVTKNTRIRKKTTLYARWTKVKADENAYPGYFTKAKYDKVKVGMTLDQVEEIVGGSYDFMMSVSIGGSVYQRNSYWNVANKSNSASEQVIIIFTPTYKVRSISNPFGW